MDTELADMPLTDLMTQLKRWEDGQLDSLEATHLVRRAMHRLNRACWCEIGRDVCCMVHSKHSTPHKNCILR